MRELEGFDDDGRPLIPASDDSRYIITPKIWWPEILLKIDPLEKPIKPWT